MDDLPENVCNSTYLPTTDEYFTAFGFFSPTILIIGGLITLGLFILFFEQVVYTNQTAHYAAKRHICWIASVFPMMTLMSLTALVIPRAHNVCLSVKMVYMSIGISHFTDLTMVMFGDEELLLERACDDTFKLQLGPMCCCCRCLPRPPVTKYSLRLVVLLTDQLPFAQAVYYVLMMILISADNITLGDVKPSGAFLWLNIFKLTSVIFGVYGFMILSNFSQTYLNDFEYCKKSLSIRLLLVITNMQSTIFTIMANYGAFPCLRPYVSPTVYKQTVDNSLYVLEMMILGPWTYWQYHDLRFSTPVTAPLPFYRSRSASFSHSNKGSITGTINTIVTGTTENSNSSDDEHGKERSNSSGSGSKNITVEQTAVIEVENEKEKVNGKSNSIRDSRKSRDDKNSSEGDSAFASNDSIRDSVSSTGRKGRKNNSREKSTSDSLNIKIEDTSKPTRDKSIKQKSSKNTPDTIPNSSGENDDSTSKNSTEERSASPTSTISNANSANPTHGTSAQTPSLLERARSLAPRRSRNKSEYERF